MSAIHLFKCKVFVFIICNILAIEANPIVNECSSCSSKDCLFRANGILKNMKSDVDPCEDFYSFACGNYLERFGKVDTRYVYDDTLHSMQILIKDLLENLKPQPGTVSEKLSLVFDSCMNKASVEMEAVPEAIEFLSDAGIPNWPNIDSNFRFNDLGETLGRLALYGEFAFVSIKPTPYKNDSLNDIFPAIILPGNFLLNSKIKPKDVQSSVLRVLAYFDVDKEASENISRNFKAVEDMGIRLQNEESKEAIGCRSELHWVHTAISCSEETDESMKLLCSIWKAAVRNGNLEKYFSADIIHISCHWNHFNYIEKILLNLGNISHESLAHYLALRFFINHLDDMNLYFHLTKKTYPEDKGSSAKVPESISRWEYCVDWIIKYMNLALGHEYAEQIFTPAIEQNAIDMIDTYVESLNRIVEAQGWIEKLVKHFLKIQINKLEIGFKSSMKRFRNQTSISSYYEEYHPVNGSFFKNVLEYGKFLVIQKDKIPFNSFSTSSDPYTLDFGFAVFMPPTYSYGLPKIWNYATLGSIIGHELSHNLKFFFDLIPLDEEMETILKDKQQCYVRQHSQFILERTGKTITSNEAKEEIIADNIGWELTEKVLKSIIDSSDNVRLFNLEYTALELMYISFAQDSCAALSKEVENEFYTSKPHNLQNFRVLGMLQNSKLFSDTFNCSSRNAMNPNKKCTFFKD